MAQITPIGQPNNDGERKAIAYLKTHLPDDYRILHNFELKKGKLWYEVDLAIIAPHAVYIIDVKGTHGRIDVANRRWYPEGRTPFHSPLPKLRDHKKVIHGMLADGKGKHNRHRVWFEAVVLLCADNAVFVDPENRDAPETIALKGCEDYFTKPGKLSMPEGFPRENTDLHLKAIFEVFQGPGARATQGLPLYGDYKCTERLTSTDAYVEYRAQNAHFESSQVLLRVYGVDPYLQEEERSRQKVRIANAFQALEKMTSHPSIPAGRSFFPTQDGDGYVMVTDDIPGISLSQRLRQTQSPLTIDQKLSVAKDLLDALAHCHRYQVVHRAISPATIILAKDGSIRLNDFDFARPGTRENNTETVAGELLDQVKEAYLAPEILSDAVRTTAATDLYAAGVTIYELLTGNLPWEEAADAYALNCEFPEVASSVVSSLPEGFDQWLQSLCAKDPAARPEAKKALKNLTDILEPQPEPAIEEENLDEPEEELDYKNLEPGEELDGKYIIESKLGKPGAFGVVYKVVDTMGDVTRAIKIITQDQSSVVERMKQEFRTLVHLPDHKRVVKVFDARVLHPGNYPYLVFEFLKGEDFSEIIEKRSITFTESVQMLREVAEGLSHLHKYKVTHGDIKPANLLWTNNTVKIVDFNVAKAADDVFARGGGTTRYMPPDFDGTVSPTVEGSRDRDLFALGVTFYEAATGHYPWGDEKRPKLDLPPKDPREFSGLENLSQKFVNLVMRLIASHRQDRFNSADEIIEALSGIGDNEFRQVDASHDFTLTTQSWELMGEEPKKNTNPFAEFLLTLYSQSKTTNAGTRGLDSWSRKIYVDTQLDRTLEPAILDGQFKLVIISGNAGDGKTAFIQQVEGTAAERGAIMEQDAHGNSSKFELNGRQFRSNYDGSQDEGNKVNDAVLLEFFEPYIGNDDSQWPSTETRLIAINEGRLVDFLEQHASKFARLRALISNGFKSGKPAAGVAVVNLNLRSVVAPLILDDGESVGSIFERLLKQMVRPEFWQPCAECDLADKCYAYHNAKTIQDKVSGPQVIGRLLKLYTLTTLRSKLHITLRDLRSALAYMLVGTRSCEEIHGLYTSGERAIILDGFYFNSWMGGTSGVVADRLIKLLRESDVGFSNDAKLDRHFGFSPASAAPQLVSFENRAKYDVELLDAEYGSLPSELGMGNDATRFEKHRAYVSMLRRRHFFECRDDAWKRLLPYQSSESMLGLIASIEDPHAAALQIIHAINKGEGVFESSRLSGKLALQVRSVEHGTVRSYRLFPAKYFRLEASTLAEESPFMEHSPNMLVLRFAGDEMFGGKDYFEEPPELEINLDIYEMLYRLNLGYRPTVDELHGYYLSLNVFKNVLGSVPYDEILLTPGGKEFYSIKKEDDGSLKMAVVEDPASYGNQT